MTGPVINGDPAYEELERQFAEYGLGIEELARAYRSLREAVLREAVSCLKLCAQDGMCECSNRIRERVKAATR